jgi:predicted HicB family RNase H-like nuclease
MEYWTMAVIMTYKGYIGKVEFDEDENELHGTVINTRDVITFVGRTVVQTKKALRDSVEVYLAHCAEEGLEPNKPYSGRILVRLDPELHAKLVERAAQEDKSLNEFAEEALGRAANAA